MIDQWQIARRAFLDNVMAFSRYTALSHYRRTCIWLVISTPCLARKPLLKRFLTNVGVRSGDGIIEEIGIRVGVQRTGHAAFLLLTTTKNSALISVMSSAGKILMGYSDAETVIAFLSRRSSKSLRNVILFRILSLSIHAACATYAREP